MKKIPVILECVTETRSVQIAGLSLLDRLIVTAHRAGRAPIYVIAKTTPMVPRAHVLCIEITVTSEIPELDKPALLIKGAVLVETADLERVIEERGQLFSGEGACLPVAMTTGGRVLYKESRLGKWLDLVGHQFVHVAVFAGIGFGLARSDPASPALALGISTVLGVIISFAVIVFSLKRKSGGKSSGLKKLIDVTTNRDFSLLVLLLAIAGKLDVFPWMAGIGVLLFWIIAVRSQWRDAGRAQTISNKSA